jgi:Kef-type K+ transport system membrane component KefB
MPAGAAEIPLSLLVVFASAKLLAEVFERLGQPGIVGEIFAGILIGPHVLGWMHPTDFLRELSDLGVMFLLFRVGLEVRARDLIRVGGTAFGVALAGVVVPFFLGWGISVLWGQPRIESFFTGAAMVATSVGITAQVLAARGLLDTRAARIILAAAVVDDVLGLIVLALVSDLARGAVHYVDVALTGALAIGFTAFVARYGTSTVRRVMPRVRAGLALVEGEFALAMTLLFALALLAVYAGVAAIIGAFLAGMALSETVDRRVHDLTNGVAELLVPFFLAGIGLHFDPTPFRSGSSLALAAVIVVAAVASKFFACGAAALRMGRADAVRVGVGMVPRGEVGMVVAQIGLNMNVMAPAVYDVIVVMSVATTLIAPPLLKLAFRAETPSRGPEADEILRVG